jgi:hypothetical protein
MRFGLSCFIIKVCSYLVVKNTEYKVESRETLKSGYLGTTYKHKIHLS